MALGGTDTDGNVQPLCRPCHRMKTRECSAHHGTLHRDGTIGLPLRPGFPRGFLGTRVSRSEDPRHTNAAIDVRPLVRAPLLLLVGLALKEHQFVGGVVSLLRVPRQSICHWSRPSLQSPTHRSVRIFPWAPRAATVSPAKRVGEVPMPGKSRLLAQSPTARSRRSRLVSVRPATAG
ncbi:HNH endonuclease [Streptomyces sp. NPDC056831]|uniref:HNH endonuclease n=1 Tax=Streptomyces sp. NPDC056831 TaxID=3345954 RepID=UPI0036A7952E